MPETHLRSLGQERYEYSSSPRSDDSEWDALVKFGMRKVRKCVIKKRLRNIRKRTTLKSSDLLF